MPSAYGLRALTASSLQNFTIDLVSQIPSNFIAHNEFSIEQHIDFGRLLSIRLNYIYLIHIAQESSRVLRLQLRSSFPKKYGFFLLPPTLATRRADLAGSV